MNKYLILLVFLTDIEISAFTTPVEKLREERDRLVKVNPQCARIAALYKELDKKTLLHLNTSYENGKISKAELELSCYCVQVIETVQELNNQIELIEALKI